MTLLVLDRRPLTVKLRSVIRLAGLSCELGRPPAPETGQNVPTPPYVVLWPLYGDFVPTLGVPDGASTVVYQATAVGENAESAEWAMDKLRSTLLGRNATGYVTDLDTAEVKVGSRWSEGPGMLDADSRLFNLAERFGFLVAAA